MGVVGGRRHFTLTTSRRLNTKTLDRLSDLISHRDRQKRRPRCRRNSPCRAIFLRPSRICSSSQNAHTKDFPREMTVSKNSSFWLMSVIGSPAAQQPGCQKLMRSEEEGAALRLSGIPANPGFTSGLPRVSASLSNLCLRPFDGALPVPQSPLSAENEQLVPWIEPKS